LLYLNIHGFPEPVCRFVRTQFRQNGYVVRFENLRLDWFSGIVAEKLSLADPKRPDEILVRITEVGLQINWSELFGGQNAICGLRIINASVSVPTPPDELGSEYFTASDANATLRFEDNGVIRVEQLTGMYCGVFLYVTGRIKPGARLESPPVARKNNFTFISKALRELHNIRSRDPLDLYLDFDIDLAQPMALRARTRFHGSDVRYRRLVIDRIELDVAMEEGAVRILGADAKLAGGELNVSGTYDLAQGQTDLHLRSTFDLMALRPLLPPDTEKLLQSFRLLQNPNITLRYVLSPETGPVPVLSGSIQTGGLEFRGVEFRAIALTFENRGPEITVSNARIVMRNGELTGHGKYHIESSDFTYEFNSTLDPTALLPLMTPVMQRWFSPCAFDEPPHIRANVRGDFVDPEAFAYDADVSAVACSYRGVALEEAYGSLRLRRNRLEVRDMILQREDGRLTGKLTADFDNQQLIFNMRTTANPAPMAEILSEKATKTMDTYRFGPNLNAAAKGFVDFAHPERVIWSADVTDDDFGWWKLTAEHGHGQLLFTNNACRLQLQTEGTTYGTNRATRAAADLHITTNIVTAANVAITINGGDIRGAVTMDVSRQRVDFQFQSNADPHTLAALLGSAAEQKLQPYHFASNTVLQAKGIADLTQPNQTAWTATLATDGFDCGKFNADHLDADLAFTNEVLHIKANTQGFQWWKLKADQATADLVASNAAVVIRDVNADLFGGKLRGQADLKAAGTNTAFRLSFDTEHCDIQRFLHTMGGSNANASGRVKAHLDLNGTGTDLTGYQGGGNFEITDGVLLEVPLFGIFSRILNAIAAGLGSTAVKSAHCTYTITNQLVKTDDLKFETSSAAVSSHGTIGFPRGDLDIRVEAQPLRSWPGINILTWMFGKIFEYKVGGTLDNPNWRPTRLPKEILPHSEGKATEAKPKNP